MTPILSSAGVVILLVIVCLSCCFYLAVILCVLALLGAVMGFLIFSGVVFTQKIRMKKFSKLKNVDILLQEQELEDDTSIAHININKKLFEIPYSEIKISGLLGEGGSSSVVYKAKWKNQVVAFKCFKTRLICQNQDYFDDFEKEVAVFSSISHPNVVSFYGCSMNPPRVGILMEFCEKGECLEYIKKYERENGKRYLLKERIRMLDEVIAAMDYLHSRSIIHRDLKCENVLLNKSEQCKIMDFGVSKISERLSQQKTKRVGTSTYMAPEVANGEESYNEKCDVFSFGIMSFVLITGNERPYKGYDVNIELRVANDPTFRPDLNMMKSYLKPEDYWLLNTTKRCWDHIPSNRPSFDDLGRIYDEKKLDDYDVVAILSSEQEKKDNQLSGEGKILELEEILKKRDQEIVELKKIIERMKMKYGE